MAAVVASLTWRWRILLASAVLVLVCWGATILVVLVVIVVSWAAVGARRSAICRTSVSRYILLAFIVLVRGIDSYLAGRSRQDLTMVIPDRS